MLGVPHWQIRPAGKYNEKKAAKFQVTSMMLKYECSLIFHLLSRLFELTSFGLYQRLLCMSGAIQVYKRKLDSEKLHSGGLTHE